MTGGGTRGTSPAGSVTGRGKWSTVMGPLTTDSSRATNARVNSTTKRVLYKVQTGAHKFASLTSKTSALICIKKSIRVDETNLLLDFCQQFCLGFGVLSCDKGTYEGQFHSNLCHGDGTYNYKFVSVYGTS